MNSPATMHTGPLGSTIHALHADAGTVAELAAVDWSRHYRRVWLDPAGGLITLMAPSRLHEDLARILDIVVDAAGSILAGAVDGLRSTRLRRPSDPPGTGIEPDCAFYIGEHAREYRDARQRTRPAILSTTSDLCRSITSAMRAKSTSAKMACAAWRLHGRKGGSCRHSLGATARARRLGASELL